jgi:adenylate cyclase
MRDATALVVRGRFRLAQVFLSYAREDAEQARDLAEALGASGHTVWWDHRIHGGSRYAEEIDRALNESDAVVVLWSQASIASTWVLDEAAEGRDSGKLVPVLIGECKPPLGYRQFQMVDLTEWQNGSSAPQPLVDAIVKTAGGTQQPPLPDAKVRALPKTSVCVLPFVNMSGESEQEYFSDGISEDITTDLSKVSALDVIARNTAFTFKGQSINVTDVAKKLGVSHVLEGSVRKAGNRVRITAQLIDGESGGHVWAERYDRDLTDIFALQDEISQAIVAALKVKLLPEEKEAIEQRGTTNVEAYNLYLMAHNYWVTANWGDVRQLEMVTRICRRAIDVDPNYARAWGLLAIIESILHFSHEVEEVDGLTAAERALSLDPNIAEALVVKARHAHEAGRFEEANEALERAVELDPESWEVNREAGRLCYYQRRFKEAALYYEKAASISETDFHSCGMLASIYEVLDDEDGVTRAAEMNLARAERAASQNPTNGLAVVFAAFALATLQENERFKEWADRALMIDPDDVVMRFNLACASALRLKDAKAALEFLEPAFKKVSVSMFNAAMTDPDLDSLRDLPRFRAMVREAKERLGISE